MTIVPTRLGPKKDPPTRQTSGPFHRKPLPSNDYHYYHDNNNNNNNNNNHQQCTTAGSSNSNSTYHSIAPIELEASPDTSSNDYDYNYATPTAEPIHGGPLLHRHLTLLDLLAVGVGGTIGSGLFVLAGLVSHKYAGPAAVLSWGISGLAALLSGCCYAELSGRIPLAGSAYAYTYCALGEWPAFLAATCLSLEYIVASAAVARSWGDKCALWLVQEWGNNPQPDNNEQHKHVWLDFLVGNGVWSPLAGLVSSSCVLLLLLGVKESKRVTNFFTALKVSLVLFMIVVGSCYVRPTNWVPFVPAPFGMTGVLRGASSTFFGYMGYDQVCGMAGETIHPKRNLPAAILWTLLTVATIYMTATLVLTGMLPWPDISPVSGFPSAFHDNHAYWAGQLSALGEIVTLPIVILITTMVQPRLQYAMAQDGLLPALFQRVNASGNLWHGTACSGSLMIIIATAIPFEHLNDMITCAVLSALSLTDSSLIVLWHEAPGDPESYLPQWLVLAFHGTALLSSLLWANYEYPPRARATDRTGTTEPFIIDGWWWAAMVSTIAMCLIPYLIQQWCPRTAVFGGNRKHYHQEQLLREPNNHDDGFFRAPCVPYLPCAAIFINWYLIAQLELVGVTGLLAFLGVASVYYFCYASHYSVGNTTGWGEARTSTSCPAVYSTDHPNNHHGLAMTEHETVRLMSPLPPATVPRQVCKL